MGCRAFSSAALASGRMVEFRYIPESGPSGPGSLCESMCVCAHLCVSENVLAIEDFNSMCVLAGSWNIWECSLCSLGNTQRPFLFKLPSS